MIRGLVLIGTGLWWAIMMGHLIRREVVPYFEYQSLPTYRSLLAERPVGEMTRHCIYFGSEIVGSARTVYYTGHHGGHLVFTHFEMTHGRLLERWGAASPNSSGRLSLVTRQRLNALYQLESFTVKGSCVLPIVKETGLVPIWLEAVREGEKMNVKYRFSNFRGSTELPFEKMSMMDADYSPMSGIGRPFVGKQWKFQKPDLGVDILTGKLHFATTFARVEARERVQLPDGRWEDAFRVEFRRDPRQELPTSRLWVNEEGEVLLQEMPILTTVCRIMLEEKKVLTPEEVAAAVEDP